MSGASFCLTAASWPHGTDRPRPQNRRIYCETRLNDGDEIICSAMIHPLLFRGGAVRSAALRRTSQARHFKSNVACCRALSNSNNNDKGRHACSMVMAMRPTQASAGKWEVHNSPSMLVRLAGRYLLRSFATSSAPSSPGDECYAKALRALEMARTLEAEKEDQRAAEQYESMIKAREREEQRAKARAEKRSAAGSAASQRLAELDAHQNKEGSGMQSRAAGVAVIKTITKQTQKERKNQVAKDNGTGSDQPKTDNEIGQYKDEAQRCLRTAAFDHSHPKALVRLGNDALEEAKQLMHATADIKNNTKDDVPSELLFLNPLGRACRLYHMAGEAGSAEGWFNLGHLFWMGFPEQEEEETSLDVLNYDASLNFGPENLPDGDRNAIDADRAAAISCFKKAVDMGDPDAMYFLGVFFLSTDDTNLDQRKIGLEFIDQAAIIGHLGALYYLALFHLNGDSSLNVSPCSPAEFVDRLNLAADAGDSDALFLRGHCHYNGEDGYMLDYNAALEDFVSAASAGNADAAISAGAMLYSGDVVPQDRRRAFELYQEAAELGSKDGWRNLVSCYMLGHGVPKSEETAKHIADTMLKGNE